MKKEQILTERREALADAEGLRKLISLPSFEVERRLVLAENVCLALLNVNETRRVHTAGPSLSAARELVARQEALGVAFAAFADDLQRRKREEPR